MAKKSAPSSAATKASERTSTASSASMTNSTSTKSTSSSSGLSYQKLGQTLYQTYLTSSSKRIKLIDSFLIFLVLLGIFQFTFCLVAGTFPFNAFLGGFGATVGQFVLLASLRIQINEDNYGQFKAVSPER
jgi:oligosaccharyltransferase complex subunit epsilon